MRVIRRSNITGKTHEMELPVTNEQINAYEAGALLQDAFPNLAAPEREFIKSGITPDEWQEHVLGKKPRALNPFELWMVKSNLETINGGVPMEEQVAILKANGYPRVAAAVQKAWVERDQGAKG